MIIIINTKYLLNCFRKSSVHLTILSRLIISINRGSPISEAEEITNLAIEYKRKHPDIVVGMEISGNPMLGKFQDFVPLLTKAKKAGLKVIIE